MGALVETLHFQHVAPTAPDTLGCRPYTTTDPFIIGECPHVYFAANQPAFAETLVEGDDGQRVRVITLPGERRSMSVASGESVERDHATHLRPPWASQHGPCQARAILALHHTRT